MSLPSRLRVWSRRRACPGTAGSGICFTQTAMFMLLPQSSGRGRRIGVLHRAPGDGEESGPWPPARRNGSIVRPAWPSVSAPSSRDGTVGPCRRTCRSGRAIDADLDVLVVGAGPAGVAAAITAHERGLDAPRRQGRLPSRQDLRRRPHGAGAPPARAARGRRPAPSPTSRRSGRPCSCRPAGRQVTLPLPDDGISSAVVPRLELDAALVDRARAARGRRPRGTRRHRAVGGRRGRGCSGHVPETTRSLARHVIAADGHYSPVRRLAASPTRPPISARGTRSASTSAASTTSDAAVGAVRGRPPPRVRVGVPAPGRPGERRLRRAPRAGRHGEAARRRCGATCSPRPSLRDVLGPRAEPEDAHRAWPIPASLHHRRAHRRPRALRRRRRRRRRPDDGRGHRAGARDRHARGGGDRPGRRRRTRRGALPPRRRAARSGATCASRRRLQQVLRSPLGARGAIRAADLTPWTRRNFARWMFEDYPRALVLTPDRWQRGHVHAARRVRAFVGSPS